MITNKNIYNAVIAKINSVLRTSEAMKTAFENEEFEVVYNARTSLDYRLEELDTLILRIKQGKELNK